MSAPEKSLEQAREERRQKRELRREKQRELNPLRARKMHDARLLWEESHPVHEASLSHPLPRVIVGCSGWFYWHWRGSVYPSDLPTKDWFASYARRFSTVELNAPFYAWPTVGTAAAWVRQAARRKFIYTVKVPELITHQKRFTGTKTLVRDFGHVADLLGARMGCFLFQLPPSFHYSPARLKGILAQLDPVRRNVVEFRHRSWWNASVYAAFRANGTIFCSCSGPGLPDDVVASGGEIYLRFHGPKRWYRHDYSREELQGWVEKAQASGAERVWAYFNNDHDGYAVSNARLFRQLLLKARPEP